MVVNRGGISRRKFVELSAVTVLAAGGLGTFAGCASMEGSTDNRENGQNSKSSDAEGNPAHEEYQGFTSIKFMFEGAEGYDPQTSVPYMFYFKTTEDGEDASYVWPIDPIGEVCIELPKACMRQFEDSVSDYSINNNGDVLKFDNEQGYFRIGYDSAIQSGKSQVEAGPLLSSTKRCRNDDGSLSDSVVEAMWGVVYMVKFFERYIETNTENSETSTSSIIVDFSYTAASSVEDLNARLSNALVGFMDSFKQVENQVMGMPGAIPDGFYGSVKRWTTRS